MAYLPGDKPARVHMWKEIICNLNETRYAIAIVTNKGDCMVHNRLAHTFDECFDVFMNYAPCFFDEKDFREGKVPVCNSVQKDFTLLDELPVHIYQYDKNNNEPNNITSKVSTENFSFSEFNDTVKNLRSRFYKNTAREIVNSK